jgi:hypothetical protein
VEYERAAATAIREATPGIAIDGNLSKVAIVETLPGHRNLPLLPRVRVIGGKLAP